MRATLSRKGDYAVRALLDIARRQGQGRRKTRDIAEAMDIPRQYLTQILADLVAGGYLEARQGPAGGYILARPAEEITLREIVEVAEGPITLDQCVLQGGPCDWVESCPIHDTWSEAQAAFTDRLESTTFADLAAIDAAIEAGDYTPENPTHDTPTRRSGTR
jgi:Rrf2 family protein